MCAGDNVDASDERSIVKLRGCEGEETSADTFTDFLCDTPETVFGRPVSLALSPFVAVREGRSPPSSPLVAAPSADCGLATPRGEALAARDTVTGLP